MAHLSDNPLLLENQLCFPLYAATNLLQRLYRPLLEPLGLTYSQYLVMLILWEREPVTVGDIGSCLHLDNGTLTPLLKRMERGGFITRRRDPDDERRVLIAPTPQGKALRAKAARIPEVLAQRIALTPPEIESLHKSAVSLVRLLTEPGISRSGAKD